MARNISSFKTISFFYNFAVNGGTVGVHSMAQFLPQCILAAPLVYLVQSSVTSAGGTAKVRINSGINILDPGTPEAAMGSGKTPMGTPPSGVFVIAISELSVQILNEDIITGSFYVQIPFYENPFFVGT